ncbi:hypothetical protein GUJ93_ZPchr0006g45822 [Zizania palustris]|uniref:Uncharacterized protein n=1 Tax=Zizania palustris TaxID=103762 RepID=A0A8J5VLT4_ZIZPA|nr:hypothetical protein GUJ93_ZPchr0006g45822 [Zizania palustris]
MMGGCKGELDMEAAWSRRFGGCHIREWGGHSERHGQRRTEDWARFDTRRRGGAGGAPRGWLAGGVWPLGGGARVTAAEDGWCGRCLVGGGAGAPIAKTASTGAS